MKVPFPKPSPPILPDGPCPLACATALTLPAMHAASASDYEVEIVSEGLVHPWAISFVPDSRLMLVTERPGNLHVINRDSGEAAPISGTPDVHARGQGRASGRRPAP